MITQTVLIVTAVKLFFIPLYRSTDFEVHRNWLAITHSLTIDMWYYDETSEWTLDYPPFFAWFEYTLSHVGKFFDREMLLVNNLNYVSSNTVLFQRLSVIVTDIIYVVGVKRCSELLSKGKFLAFVLMIANPGLLMVDHIHFQYNGFLFGILLISVAHIIQGNHIWGAFWFVVLLNFKHIFLYMAPAYFVYLLRVYCFTVSSRDGVSTAWYSFSVVNLMKLGATVIAVFAVAYGPFIKHLPQIATRLFPFKRGLSHAYWAPNFWALYNFVDKVLYTILLKLGRTSRSTEASMTSGLVQEYAHSVLPSVTPVVTFAVTAIAMAPALIKMWSLGADKRYRVVNFVRCLVVCASCSFMFGWHVHEKAILMTLIPMSFLAQLGATDGRLFLFLSLVGHYSLTPLLYPHNLLYIKTLMILIHATIAFGHVPNLYDTASKKVNCRSTFTLLYGGEIVYLSGFVLLFLYENFVHSFLGLNKSLPFLPLMLTSVYCAVGVTYFFVSYYYYFVTFNLSSLGSKLPKLYDKVKAC